VPDPRDPDVIYGGRLRRFDRRTRQVRDIAPRAAKSDDYRVVRTHPVATSADGGRSWTAARALGESTVGILMRRVLPNSLPPVFVAGDVEPLRSSLEGQPVRRSKQTTANGQRIEPS